MAVNAGGRPTIFPGKNYKNRHTFALTDTGERHFNASRKRLAKLAGWKAKDVTDSDVSEYLALGHEKTKAYLQQKRK